MPHDSKHNQELEEMQAAVLSARRVPYDDALQNKLINRTMDKLSVAPGMRKAVELAVDAAIRTTRRYYEEGKE